MQYNLFSFYILYQWIEDDLDWLNPLLLKELYQSYQGLIGFLETKELGEVFANQMLHLSR